MKGILHAIVGTPDSNRRSTLAHAVNPTEKRPSSHFLFPHELESTELPFSHWDWIDQGFEIKNLEEENIDEWFLFSNIMEFLSPKSIFSGTNPNLISYSSQFK